MPPPPSGFAKGVLSVFDFLKREKTNTTVRDDEGSPVSTLRTASTSSSTSSGSGRPGSAPVSTTTSPHGSVSGRTTPIPPRPGTAQVLGSGRTTVLPPRAPKPPSTNTTPSGSGPARTTTLPPRPPKKSASTTPAPSGSGPARTAPKKPASNSNRKSQSDGKSTPSNAAGTTQKLPHGNLFPSGEIKATGMEQKPKEPYRVGSMPWDYGIGSVIPGRAGAHEAARRLAARTSKDPEELKRMGNDCYRGGFFAEALVLYDKAIAITPGDATYHGNRAAALIGLKRLHEAVSECEEAIKLDAEYVRAHHRLGYVLLCLGQVENARKHLCISEKQQADPEDMRKLKSVEQHLSRCTAARRSDDWTATLREADAAIKSGADSSPQLIACRAEALLKLLRLDDAFSALSDLHTLEPSPSSNPNLKIFGMVLEAYTLFVKAQVELAKGRYDSAIICAEQAGKKDPSNAEIFDLLDKATSVRRAHASGNELFEKDRLTEACSAYAEGIKYDPSNYILYCNRAACWLKLGQYERAVHDCNQALRIQPNYLKALFRRATAYSKLGHWKEAVRDYEVLRRELPDDREIGESLYDAQVEVMKLRGDKVSNLQFGGEVASVSDIEQFRAVISSPCASVVLFRRASDSLCRAITPFVDELCIRYPSMTFVKVDIDEIPKIAQAEQVCIVPTFKIYRKGNRAKEIICPSREALETAVRHYSI